MYNVCVSMYIHVCTQICMFILSITDSFLSTGRAKLRRDVSAFNYHMPPTHTHANVHLHYSYIVRINVFVCFVYSTMHTVPSCWLPMAIPLTVCSWTGGAHQMSLPRGTRWLSAARETLHSMNWEWWRYHSAVSVGNVTRKIILLRGAMVYDVHVHVCK